MTVGLGLGIDGILDRSGHPELLRGKRVSRASCFHTEKVDPRRVLRSRILDKLISSCPLGVPIFFFSVRVTLGYFENNKRSDP